MRRRILGVIVGLCACGSRGDPGSQPPQAATPSSTAPASNPEPELEPESEPEAEAEPVEAEAEPVEAEAPEAPAEVEKLWPAKWEPRILAVQPYVAEAAAAHGVDPHLVNGVIWVESKFDRKARNRSGARGLMQLMPKTAKSLGRALKRPTKVYDAEFNVHAGTYYLSRLLEKFDGDETLALASYVRGPARVRAWVDEGHPFPDGVAGFIDKVRRARAVFVALGWPAPPPELALEPPPESGPDGSADEPVSEIPPSP